MYRKKMYCVQSIHTRKNEGGPLYAKLRALDGSRGTEGVNATSTEHQQTFFFLNLTYFNDCTECCAFSWVVEAPKAISIHARYNPSSVTYSRISPVIYAMSIRRSIFLDMRAKLSKYILGRSENVNKAAVRSRWLTLLWMPGVFLSSSSSKLSRIERCLIPTKDFPPWTSGKVDGDTYWVLRRNEGSSRDKL